MKLKIIALLILTLMTATTQADPLGTAFTYQGRLNAVGVPANGSYDFIFTLYTNSAAGNQLNLFPANAVPVTNGLFTASLDFGNLFDGTAYWLGISVRTNGGGSYLQLNPRQPLTPVPNAVFASSAASASNVVNGAISANQLGTPSAPAPGQVLAWNGSSLVWSNTSGGGGGAGWSLTGNSGTTPTTQFIGTTDNQPLEIRVNGARAFRIESGPDGPPNLIGGSLANYVSPGISGAVIAGGGGTNYGETNVVLAGYSTIGGGYGNVVLSGRSTIAGGSENSISNATRATIGGGTGNSVQATSSTIAGGYQNSIEALATYSFIGGGRSNIIQAEGLVIKYGSVIGGGYQNLVQSNADGSVIGGGRQNIIQTNAHLSFIGGGQLNTIHDGAFISFIGGGALNSIAPGCSRSFIGAGDGNQIQSGGGSVIGGGMDNIIVNGDSAVIPGGNANTASGYESFAAGWGANAAHDNSFVWSSSMPTTSTAAGQFMVRANGGVVFYTTLSGTTTGVRLSAGSGTWSSLSDRNSKEHFVPVDGKAVLEKVAEMPLNTWSYKSQDKSIRHIGPVAQDFYAAFNVGEDDQHIATIDEGGVALAAIQGLNQRLKEKDAEIQELKQNMAELKTLVQSLAKKK